MRYAGRPCRPADKVVDSPRGKPGCSGTFADLPGCFGVRVQRRDPLLGDIPADRSVSADLYLPISPMLPSTVTGRPERLLPRRSSSRRSFPKSLFPGRRWTSTSIAAFIACGLALNESWARPGDVR
ncbi:hypothetical protein [Alicyclobacillus cycloheptanicus]|uniref:Uncharacterized protein n=1 Tax=Alicyclobacillus cycloheptanicus TaxID=1457 RepID=A0ABT9XLD3_9BACL|nr:hypothetical protein [Alicyclobacillus cycloheptanicus]MDQ0191122.1 hypothetical protein [Alicyclobacillus cycloheptanicus]